MHLTSGSWISMACSGRLEPQEKTEMKIYDVLYVTGLPDFS
jgi:hypothetical protein